MGSGIRLAGLALLATWGVTVGAQAELYRCVEPDGSVSFTDNPGGCGNARVHEPADVVQKVPSRTAPPAARRPSASRSVLRDQAEADAERLWRDKKQSSERELAAIRGHRERLQEYVIWCNRGGDLYRKDESGLKRKVSCKEVARELDTLDRRIVELDAYLEEGLEEECRRAGCLPGWIR